MPMLNTIYRGLPIGIFNLSCSFLNAGSTIHRVTFSDSSGNGITTFCEELLLRLRDGIAEGVRFELLTTER